METNAVSYEMPQGSIQSQSFVNYAAGSMSICFALAAAATAVILIKAMFSKEEEKPAEIKAA